MALTRSARIETGCLSERHLSKSVRADAYRKSDCGSPCERVAAPASSTSALEQHCDCAAVAVLAFSPQSPTPSPSPIPIPIPNPLESDLLRSNSLIESNISHHTDERQTEMLSSCACRDQSASSRCDRGGRIPKIRKCASACRQHATFDGAGNLSDGQEETQAHQTIASACFFICHCLLYRACNLINLTNPQLCSTRLLLLLCSRSFGEPHRHRPDVLRTDGC